MKRRGEIARERRVYPPPPPGTASPYWTYCAFLNVSHIWLLALRATFLLLHSFKVCLELLFPGFPVRRIGVHETFEHPAVIRREQMDSYLYSGQIGYS